MPLHSLLDDTFTAADELNSVDKFKSFLDPEILEQAIEYSAVATVRCRRLPLDAVMLSIIGMSLFRNEPVWDIDSKLDISLPGKSKLVAPSALVQARQRLGGVAVGRVFHMMVQRTFHQEAFEQWCGLNLVAVDAVVFRAQDTQHNLTEFGLERNNQCDVPIPRLRCAA